MSYQRTCGRAEPCADLELETELATGEYSDQYSPIGIVGINADQRMLGDLPRTYLPALCEHMTFRHDASEAARCQRLERQ